MNFKQYYSALNDYIIRVFFFFKSTWTFAKKNNLYEHLGEKKIQLRLKVSSDMYGIYNLDAMKLLLEYGL